MKLKINPKMFNPLYWHIRAALRDNSIRHIVIEGGSSASKTHTICQALLLDQYERDYWSLVFRRFHVDIKDSVYRSFKKTSTALRLTKDYYTFQEDVIKSVDDAGGVRFRGLDDEEDIKGIEGFRKVYLNEFNQFTEKQHDQLKKRLRGMENQQLIYDWNPISSELWIYKNWLDRQEWTDLPLSVDNCPSKYSSLNSEFAFKRINKKGDTLWIKVTYRDNFWVIGHPSGKGGLYDVHTLEEFENDRIYKPNLYRIYANGERGIIRTGGEFWKQFSETRHVGAVKADIDNTIHLSLDQNHKPYVTVSAWQIDDKAIRQVHEIPCREPDNNAVKSAQRTAHWLHTIGYEDVVYVYGDPAGNAGNTIDENNLSFYDKYIATLKAAGFTVVRRIAKAHAGVAISAAFINDIYEQELYGYSITIGDHCKVSIDDYTAVKEAKDGSMLKLKIKDKDTGVTYEPNGHFSDAKRYFITQILADEFRQYQQRHNKDIFIISS